MESIQRKTEKLRKFLKNYYLNVVVPLQEENAALKEKNEMLEIEVKRLRNQNIKLVAKIKNQKSVIDVLRTPTAGITFVKKNGVNK